MLVLKIFTQRKDVIPATGTNLGDKILRHLTLSDVSTSSTRRIFIYKYEVANYTTYEFSIGRISI